MPTQMHPSKRRINSLVQMNFPLYFGIFPPTQAEDSCDRIHTFQDITQSNKINGKMNEHLPIHRLTETAWKHENFFGR